MSWDQAMATRIEYGIYAMAKHSRSSNSTAATSTAQQQHQKHDSNTNSRAATIRTHVQCGNMKSLY